MASAAWKDMLRSGKTPPMYFGVRKRELKSQVIAARADPVNAGELTPKTHVAWIVKPRQGRVLSSRYQARPDAASFPPAGAAYMVSGILPHEPLVRRLPKLGRMGEAVVAEPGRPF